MPRHYIVSLKYGTSTLYVAKGRHPIAHLLWTNDRADARRFARIDDAISFQNRANRSPMRPAVIEESA